MTFKEIVEKAREACKDEDKYEAQSHPGVKPPIASGPRARKFVKMVLEECEKNGIEIPFVDKESFLAQFSDGSISKTFAQKNWTRRSQEQRNQAHSFIRDRDAQDGMVVTTFAESTELSDVDKEFLFESHVLLIIAERETPSKNIEIPPLQDERKHSLAIEYLGNSIKKIEQELKRPIQKNLGDERSIAAIIGVPGSGKSTFIEQLKRKGYIPMDLDQVAVNLANEYGVKISEYENVIYDQAGLIVDEMATEAMKLGYNIAVEKIGHTKSEVYGFTDKYVNSAREIGLKPKAELFCAHVSKEASTVRASARTVDQIMNGETLRYYKEDAVYNKDNTSLYTYLEILQEQLDTPMDKTPRFAVCELKVKEGVSANDGNIMSATYSEEERAKHQARVQEQQRVQAYSSAKGKSGPEVVSDKQLN